LLVAIALFVAVPTLAQEVQEIPFDSVSALQLPEGMYLGEVAGVAATTSTH
jgi:hypothetical protein